jgi:flagellar biosynthetic protein FliR
VNGFLRSFTVIPARGIAMTDIANALTKNIGEFFLAAIEVAGPVLACLFLTEVTIGLLARAAPALNVFALGFPLRVIVALVLVAFAVPLLSPAVGNLVHYAMVPFGVG